MDYRTAYEALSSALWQYDKAHSDAHFRLMTAMSDIEEKLGKPPKPPKPPIPWPPNDDADT